MLEHIKQAYLLWHEYHSTLSKIHRYSLGGRIDSLLIETLEAITSAMFLAKQDKLPYVRLAIRKVDTIKILLMVLWETKSLDTKKYAALSIKLDEVGKMLGGWNGQLMRQNSTPPERGEK